MRATATSLVSLAPRRSPTHHSLSVVVSPVTAPSVAGGPPSPRPNLARRQGGEKDAACSVFTNRSPVHHPVTGAAPYPTRRGAVTASPPSRVSRTPRTYRGFGGLMGLMSVPPVVRMLSELLRVSLQTFAVVAAWMVGVREIDRTEPGNPVQLQNSRKGAGRCWSVRRWRVSPHPPVPACPSQRDLRSRRGT